MIEPKQRQVLRVLDACLQDLEDAHERDESLVPESVMRAFWPQLPWLSATMSIRQAIDIVFAEQESILRAAGALSGDYGDGRTPVRPGPVVSVPARIRAFAAMPPLDEAGALRLTENIRTATRQVCLLLLEAHERRVWVVLNYTRWEDYVASEFGFSRSRSYELLDQGRVILALQEAACMTQIPDISGYTASAIKHCLPEITEKIRERVEGGGAVPMRHVLDVVGLYRARAKALSAAVDADEAVGSPNGSAEGRKDPGLNRIPLHEITAWLANLPPVEVVMGRIGRLNRYDPVAVERAARWLSAFAAELDLRRGEPVERLRVMD